MNTEYMIELNKFANDIYLDTEEEATAERMIRFFTARALWLHHSLEVHEPYVDDKRNPQWFMTLEAMQAMYGSRVALAALAEADGQRSNEVAKELWGAAFAGDHYGEFLWEWAIESDIPVSPESLDGKTQAEAKAEMEAEEAELRQRQEAADAAFEVVQSFGDRDRGVPRDDLVAAVRQYTSCDEPRAMRALNDLYAQGRIETVKAGDGLIRRGSGGPIMRLRIAFAKSEEEEWPNVITATDSYMEEDQGGVPSWYQSTVDAFADDDDCETQELFVDIPDEAVRALFPTCVVTGEVVES